MGRSLAVLLALTTAAHGFIAPTPAARWVTRRSVMSAAALTQEELKQQAGYKAVDDYVESGMVVGLGTGSTAAYAVERLGELLKSGATIRLDART
jgi:ribose 5-phosphate isomerase A